MWRTVYGIKCEKNQDLCKKNRVHEGQRGRVKGGKRKSQSSSCCCIGLYYTIILHIKCLIEERKYLIKTNHNGNVVLQHNENWNKSNWSFVCLTHMVSFSFYFFFFCSSFYSSNKQSIYICMHTSQSLKPEIKTHFVLGRLSEQTSTKIPKEQMYWMNVQ